jgi:hypothetical protein
MPMPSVIGARSTSTEDSASTSADGFMLSISGQAMAPTPIAAPATVTSFRKSRLVPVAACADPAGMVTAWSAIAILDLSPDPWLSGGGVMA